MVKWLHAQDYPLHPLRCQDQKAETAVPELQEEMTKDENLIKFLAQVAKVQTMADGGIRLIFDLPETAIETATKMMQTKQAGALLEIVALPVKKRKDAGKSRKNKIADDISATY